MLLFFPRLLLLELLITFRIVFLVHNNCPVIFILSLSFLLATYITKIISIVSKPIKFVFVVVVVVAFIVVAVVVHVVVVVTVDIVVTLKYSQNQVSDK